MDRSDYDVVPARFHSAVNRFNMACNEYAEIPERTKGALRRYLVRGVSPGGFVTACLENNLAEAIGRADSENLEALPHIVKLIYNHIPSTAWGSKGVVSKWIKHEGLAGKE